jgi:hypothetical protein
VEGITKVHLVQPIQKGWIGYYPAFLNNQDRRYYALPILNILVPQVGQVPWVAGF